MSRKKKIGYWVLIAFLLFFTVAEAPFGYYCCTCLAFRCMGLYLMDSASSDVTESLVALFCLSSIAVNVLGASVLAQKITDVPVKKSGTLPLAAKILAMFFTILISIMFINCGYYARRQLVSGRTPGIWTMELAIAMIVVAVIGMVAALEGLVYYIVKLTRHAKKLKAAESAS